VLGSGGMGRVYLGRTTAGVTAAVKVIHAGLARDPEFRTRFRRDVETTVAVTGSRIASVLDADIDAEPPWPATEYVAGPSLAGAVAASGPLGARGGNRARRRHRRRPRGDPRPRPWCIGT